jgi:hypothetical protein
MQATIDGVRVFCEPGGGEDPYGSSWPQAYAACSSARCVRGGMAGQRDPGPPC